MHWTGGEPGPAPRQASILPLNHQRSCVITVKRYISDFKYGVHLVEHMNKWLPIKDQQVGFTLTLKSFDLEKGFTWLNFV